MRYLKDFIFIIKKLMLLEESTKNYEKYKNGIIQEKPKLGSHDLIREITYIKQNSENSFLYDVLNISLQQRALDLSKAFQAFFKKKAGYPQFKKKTGFQSFRLVGPTFKIEDNKLVMYKCKKPVKVKWDRELPSKPSSLTISKTPTGEYYVSFVCKDVYPNVTNGVDEIGIDFGLKDFVSISDGSKVKNPKYYVKHQLKLRKAQKAFSRKKKGSKNREKARLRVAKIHQTISNLRVDFLHKLSRSLVNDNQVIGIENLNIKRMSRNRRLSKHILDSGWNAFVRFLTYKVEESHGCILVKMDTFYPSSHLCSETNKKLDRKLNLSERSWRCHHCGNIHDRDTNAALNILNRAKTAIDNSSVLLGSVIQDKYKA